jgi:hypothetical protein
MLTSTYQGCRDRFAFAAPYACWKITRYYGKYQYLEAVRIPGGIRLGGYEYLEDDEVTGEYEYEVLTNTLLRICVRIDDEVLTNTWKMTRYSYSPVMTWPLIRYS